MTAVAPCQPSQTLPVTALTPLFDLSSIMRPRPHLRRHINEQLHDGMQDAIDTRILASGSWWIGQVAAGTRLCAEAPRNYSTIFWIEAG